MTAQWRKPAYAGEYPTLGWGIVDFIENYLRVPAGDGTGQPLKLTDEQVLFICAAHRIHPVSGKWFYRRSVLRRPKGWGKSPVVGAVALAHLAGPVVFDGWDANGEPVGKPHPSPWVQVAATAEDQTDNTWAPVMAMTAESSADQLGLDVGLTRIFLKGRPGRMEPVTAKAPSKARPMAGSQSRRSIRLRRPASVTWVTAPAASAVARPSGCSSAPSAVRCFRRRGRR